MVINKNTNCISFLVLTKLVISLIVQSFIIIQSFHLIDCLSLTELHSTLPSNHDNNKQNNQFKSRLAQEKSIRDAIRNLNNHQRSTNNRDTIINTNNYHHQNSVNKKNYELIVDNLDDGNAFNQQYLPGLPVISDYDDVDLTQVNLPNFLIVKSPETINGINKRQDEVVMDMPLEYTSDIPYEFYPELWPSKQQKSSQGKDEDDNLSSSDILSQILAAKIANLLELSESNEHSSQRKRVLVKRNQRSGLSGSPSNHRSRSNRVSNLPSRMNSRSTGSSKSMSDMKHRSLGQVTGKESKVTSRKLGEAKKVKLNRIPLKSTLNGHPVKGDFAKLVNGKAVHVSSMMHPKIINSTAFGHKETKKSKKQQTIISKNFRKTEAINNRRSPKINLNRKEKPSSMKEFFNEINLPKGPKNIVKRSLSAADSLDFGFKRDDDTVDGYNSNLTGDDDVDDGDDSVDGVNKNTGPNIDDGDIESEVNEGEYRTINQLVSSQPNVFQSNPWLVDEATRTLMRSLTVKRRKRGNSEDDQLALIGLDDDVTTTTNSPSIDEKDEDGESKMNKIGDDQMNRVNEIDEPTGTIPDIIDFGVIDEIPARIVKKDGVTLTEGQTGSDENDNENENIKVNINYNNKSKKLEKGLTNGSQLKSLSTITSILDDLNSHGDNATFFEEEISEGLITIGDLDDYDKINKSISLINDDDDDTNSKKKNDPKMRSNSSSSTPSPFTTINEDEGKVLIEGIVDDDQGVNGSIDDQLLMETINKGLYVNNKRKRSVTPFPYFGEVGQPSLSSSSSSLLVAQEAAKFIDVDEKLERIEEKLILEALDLIKNNLNGETGQLSVDDVKHRIVSRLNAAYDLEDMRLALTDLHKIMQKMSTEEDDDNGEDQVKVVNDKVEVIDDDRNDHGNEIINGDVDYGGEIYLDATDKLMISSKLDSDSDDEQFDDERDVKGDIGKRNKYIGHLKRSQSNLSPLNHHRNQMITKNHHLNQFNFDECPAIRTLTTDCSAVKDVVPYGPLQKIFGQACNWHEVCYSCGELFGLLSSDCDMGFLELSRLACNDSASCETASRLILMPLKSRRTFYKQKVPSTCYRQPCVENFLRKR